jgi:TRAP-type C4-dicarboxylate transport system permease small subunit
MARPKEVLSREDYENYRNVRAAAVLFVVFGGIFGSGGILMATNQKPDPHRDSYPAVGIGMAIVGLAGAVGGIAALRGNRQWAKLAYVMAVPYLLVFPIGTIMSYIVLSGLSRYLDSKERVRKATVGTLKSDFADRWPE